MDVKFKICLFVVYHEAVPTEPMNKANSKEIESLGKSGCRRKCLNKGLKVNYYNVVVVIPSAGVNAERKGRLLIKKCVKHTKAWNTLKIAFFVMKSHKTTHCFFKLS